MRLIRARLALAGALVAVAGTAAGAVLAAGPAAAGSGQVVLVNPCSGHGQVRPARYDIGCMPSSELVTGMNWTNWRSVAFGRGVLKVNRTPTCAQGKCIKYPILAVLWLARPWRRRAAAGSGFRGGLVVFAGSPGERVAGAEHALAVGERALEQGECLGQPARGVVGVGEVAP
jgi:hypothetical protein